MTPVRPLPADHPPVPAGHSAAITAHANLRTTEQVQITVITAVHAESGEAQDDFGVEKGGAGAAAGWPRTWEYDGSERR
eukprot:CAMPEP_0184716044 /NCGR_PEP_ID=MMETSP0314-20130426/5861_1 /TAXON_ID=38298 /ORGANISM="Rhodella maculata, Strain CCMP 736" /LENGTH=78 /DNA_ID=CAMNT_0027179353 /DNA_START=1104 /DNA_END=1340 /DNA_ORIENTATION=-